MVKPDSGRDLVDDLPELVPGGMVDHEVIRADAVDVGLAVAGHRAPEALVWRVVQELIEHGPGCLAPPVPGSPS
jgi:hypothetical protein